MISKIGFIGAGKVGTSLGKYFSEKDIRLSGYYSKTKNHAAQSAEFTKSKLFENLNDLVNGSDVIFVTVPDDAISHVWHNLKELDIKGKYIIHCSGAMSSLIFDEADETGAYVYSLHPMAAVCTRMESWKGMDGVYFTIEGNENKIKEMTELIEKTGNPVSEISADSKTLYHAASVFVSNLVVGVVAAGKNIFEECGLSKDFSENAWKSLFLGNAENIAEKGLTDALTGPVERADSNTVAKHLNVLEGSDESIYKELSRMILDVAKVKHPERDYTNIDKELN